ncbi:hypothetical protein [Tractidigestivibacter sp.]|uniref:hypothetical protein n=1 Tax=Tractidigestivibacter sp. TaxID=2847320 RepID=UPI002A908842|nr:hypothetical protein [Tractidigestivibacter sp.]MDY5270782.1 hypothetical protein [Tractidigestivibacter sp.]
MEKKIRYLLLVSALVVTSLVLARPAHAHAEVLPQGAQPVAIRMRRTPMPYTKTLTASKAARSASTGGFAYIYLKADVTIDGQYGSVVGINGVWCYQADASRYFVRWEELSLKYRKTSSTSVWAKATGYVYFSNPSTGMQDKYYLEIEHTWTV